MQPIYGDVGTTLGLRVMKKTNFFQKGARGGVEARKL